MLYNSIRSEVTQLPFLVVVQFESGACSRRHHIGGCDARKRKVHLRPRYVDGREAPKRMVLLQVGVPRRQARVARTIRKRIQRHAYDRARAAKGNQEAPQALIAPMNALSPATSVGGFLFAAGRYMA
jgi:hypothetical protein